MSVAKIVEIVGNSEKGWEDAAQVAVTVYRWSSLSDPGSTLYSYGRNTL